VSVTTQVLKFEAHFDGLSDVHSKFCPGGAEYPFDCRNTEEGCGQVYELNYIIVLAILFLIAVLIIPYLGRKWAVDTIAVTGPLLVFLLVEMIVRFRVFGEYTKQKLFLGYEFGFEDIDWVWSTKVSCILAVILLPLYGVLRAVLHTYYQRCLSRNFFANGKDVPLRDLRDKTDYCPLLIVTGTSSDYRSPIVGDNDTISELSFSPLHCGSTETGFISEPPWRTLGKITALTAAGCIDAVALTLSSYLTLRFWLQVINLTWGNYILFTPESEEVLPTGLSKVIRQLPMQWQSAWVQLFDTLPSALAVGSIWLAIFVGFTLEKCDKTEESCQTEDWRTVIFIVAFAAFTFIVLLAFCPFTWIAREMTQSAFIRQLLQLTRYTYRGDHPPPSLYITDGGCRDCTTLRQLLIRRQDKILLVLAASDKDDDLAVLKTAIGICTDLGLASFFDPKDPRLQIMGCDGRLAEFKEDKTISTLHLGIRYQKTTTEPAKSGHLYIVKNRLPPDQKAHPVEPHLTVDEMCGEVTRGCGRCPDGVQPFDSEAWGDMTTDSLGSFCCCDCMHTNGICGNCGPTFPHGSFANFMYMTPMWCSSLARLGFDVSEDAARLVSRPGSHEAQWEKLV